MKALRNRLGYLLSDINEKVDFETFEVRSTTFSARLMKPSMVVSYPKEIAMGFR